MRTILTFSTFIFFFLTSSSAIAQQSPPTTHDDRARFLVGFTGGTSLSMFNGDEFENTALKFGIVGGLRGIIAFGDTLGAQPEVLFVQRGTAFDDIDDAWLTLNYIQIPLLLRLTFTMGPVTPKLLAGPTVGYLLDGSVRVDGLTLGLDPQDFSSIDFGGALGAGADIDAGRGSLSLDVRFNHSILDITDGDENTFNSAFDILLGYNFRF